ncbi:hypothetical protein ACFV6F_26590 [Kitasatospora phosalacinea]
MTCGSTMYGAVHLYYDSSTGKNCAVTVATSADGKVDADTCKYCAGPVSL